MPTSEFSIKALKIKLLAGEQRATEVSSPLGQPCWQVAPLTCLQLALVSCPSDKGASGVAGANFQGWLGLLTFLHLPSLLAWNDPFFMMESHARAGPSLTLCFGDRCPLFFLSLLFFGGRLELGGLTPVRISGTDAVP